MPDSLHDRFGIHPSVSQTRHRTAPNIVENDVFDLPYPAERHEPLHSQLDVTVLSPNYYCLIHSTEDSEELKVVRPRSAPEARTAYD